MSGKRINRKRRRNFPWMLVVVGAVLVAVAAFLFASRSGGGGAGGTPVISVDPESIDYGHQELGTNLTFEIKVSNRGDGVLRFKEKPYIQVLEGC
jgi:hypothetical protein